MRKRWITAVLSGVLLVSSTVAPLLADELSNANQDLNALHQQEQAARERLNQVTYTADILKTQVTQLDTQIAAANKDLKQKEAAVNSLLAQIEVTQAELEQKQQDLDARRNALGQRMRGIYEDGQVSYFEVLFEAATLSDLITRVEYLGYLIDNDQQLLYGIREEKAKVESKETELQAQKDEAVNVKNQQAAVKADLDSKKAQQQQLLTETKQAENDLLIQIEKMEADSAALTKKIRELSASLSGNRVVGSIYQWPLKSYFTISSPFGYRIHPITKLRSLHTGTDIPAPTGTPIMAAGDGVVIMASDYGAFGNSVIIDHGSGYTTLYAHQSKMAARVGQTVYAGDVIGYVGTTGWSTGPHLHFEVRVDGNPTDAMQFFPNL
ncbi:MAG: peptidoglycan DD-metalloendopeptidase family protein [Peptococcaceae bacterium]|jgi:murein DD-endopeptidase MepM/ murein hydrolase activator NlpD|nr:peptidoglycan DD-metalloendopeptidase family protein [Peptococcaceae bacterium]